MVIGIFGESCTGKSTIAEALSKRKNASIFTDKDFLKLAKNEFDAKKTFSQLLESYERSNDLLIYVISEKEHLQLLPESSFRILVTTTLDIIKERFAKRTNGILSPPVASMIEKRHGMFDNEKYNLHISNSNQKIDEICDNILQHF